MHSPALAVINQAHVRSESWFLYRVRQSPLRADRADRSQTPPAIGAAEPRLGKGRDVDAPERSRPSLDGLDDGGADHRCMGDGQSRARRALLRVEPNRNPTDQGGHGFASVRSRARIPQPVCDGVQFLRLDLVEGTTGPTTAIAVTQHRLGRRGKIEGLGRLACAQRGAHEISICTMNAMHECGELLPSVNIDRLVGRKRRRSQGRRRCVANQFEASGHRLFAPPHIDAQQVSAALRAPSIQAESRSCSPSQRVPSVRQTRARSSPK